MQIRSITCALALAAGSVGTAVAGPLNLSPLPPDVASGFILITYNASTFEFAARGVTQNIALPGGIQEPAGLHEFTLLATIDNAGNALGGSLMVRTDHNSPDSIAFSSSSLTAFGFGATNKFEFIFSQSVGNLASAGTSIGTILVSPLLSFPNGVPDFSASFNNEIFPGFGDGNADTFVIPAPSSLALVGLAGL
ncbi:MAG: hypothetical protein NTV94_19805, partial [Planctomycetota bacterium]|nr:hypothetical protein [Planctomycetota bacterium]